MLSVLLIDDDPALLEILKQIADRSSDIRTGNHDTPIKSARDEYL